MGIIAVAVLCIIIAGSGMVSTALADGGALESFARGPYGNDCYIDSGLTYNQATLALVACAQGFSAGYY